MRPSIRGLAARKWLDAKESRLRATFATRKSGPSAVVKSSGATIRVDAPLNPIGAARCCGTTAQGCFNSSMGGGSASSAHPWLMSSIIKSIPHGALICSS